MRLKGKVDSARLFIELFIDNDRTKTETSNATGGHWRTTSGCSRWEILCTVVEKVNEMMHVASHVY